MKDLNCLGRRLRAGGPDREIDDDILFVQLLLERLEAADRSGRAEEALIRARACLNNAHCAEELTQRWSYINKANAELALACVDADELALCQLRMENLAPLLRQFRDRLPEPFSEIELPGEQERGDSQGEATIGGGDLSSNPTKTSSNETEIEPPKEQEHRDGQGQPPSKGENPSNGPTSTSSSEDPSFKQQRQRTCEKLQTLAQGWHLINEQALFAKMFWQRIALIVTAALVIAVLFAEYAGRLTAGAASPRLSIWAIVAFGVLGGAVSTLMGSREGVISAVSYRSKFWKGMLRLVLGGTGALITYLAVQGGLVLPELESPEQFLVISFIAGFSERFFVSTIERLSGNTTATNNGGSS